MNARRYPWPADRDPSGRALAEAAHEAGAVKAVEERPLVDVELHFVIHGGEQDADRVVAEIARYLLEHGYLSTALDSSLRVRP